MQSTPRGLRLHIGIFGRSNVGKSSLLNTLTRQNAPITNCGAAIGRLPGVFERALAPFPEALAAYRKERGRS